jgi:hypothetical protein
MTSVGDRASLLMRQAPATAQTYLMEAVQMIDAEFGEGYAKSHPSLVGAFIQTCALDYLACFTRDAFTEMTGALSGISDAVYYQPTMTEAMRAENGKERT